jgi:uncharacterized protein YecE (DUF72 family)
MTRNTGVLRVGTSGYQYDHWRGIFYPESLPKRRWFECYAGQFDTVEINNTFYRLPKAATFDSWREQAPDGFCYAVKLSRFGTHMKKLKDPETWLGNFMERAGRLEPHLGPILAQLPGMFKLNQERLSGFFSAAPHNRRWAVEFRDPSWLRYPVFRILKDHGVALCFHDKIANHPEEITTDWIYIRFHGCVENGNYPAQDLRVAARKILKYLRDGLDVYAYFNNDLDGYALSNARDLRRFVESPDI